MSYPKTPEITWIILTGTFNNIIVSLQTLKVNYNAVFYPVRHGIALVLNQDTNKADQLTEKG